MPDSCIAEVISREMERRIANEKDGILRPGMGCIRPDLAAVLDWRRFGFDDAQDQDGHVIELVVEYVNDAQDGIGLELTAIRGGNVVGVVKGEVAEFSDELTQYFVDTDDEWFDWEVWLAHRLFKRLVDQFGRDRNV